MNHSDVIDYFQDIAARLLLLQPTNASDGNFARNSDHLKEKLVSKLPCRDFTLIMDDPTGRGMYTTNYHDLPIIGFWIVKKVANGNYVAEDAAYDGAKQIMWKILSKMAKDREEEEGLMRWFDFSSLNYKKVVFSDNLAGIEVSLGTVDPVGDSLVYDEGEWI